MKKLFKAIVEPESCTTSGLVWDPLAFSYECIWVSFIALC